MEKLKVICLLQPEQDSVNTDFHFFDRFTHSTINPCLLAINDGKENTFFGLLFEECKNAKCGTSSKKRAPERVVFTGRTQLQGHNLSTSRKPVRFSSYDLMRHDQTSNSYPWSFVPSVTASSEAEASTFGLLSTLPALALDRSGACWPCSGLSFFSAWPVRA